MKSLLFFCVFLTGASLTQAATPQDYILSYSELKEMSLSERTKYFQKVSSYLLLLETEPKKKVSLLLSQLFPKAYADTDFRCIGGGVPVPSNQENCGVSSYAGFSCEGEDEGKEICNPLIFGLLSSGKPLCYEDATTKKCYDNTVTGTTTHFSDEAFSSPETKAAYQEFKEAIDGICSEEKSVQEATRYRNEACNLMYRQSQVNRRRLESHQLTSPHTEGAYLNEPSFEDTELGSGGGGDASAPTQAAYSLHSTRVAAEFVARCRARGIRQELCDQMTRPNEHSRSAFRRVYPGRPFVLMPSVDRWEEGLQLLEIAARVERQTGARICQLANWYRPEPYNSAVDGARRSRHLNAGAIDIHFCSRRERNAALEAFRREESRHSRLGIGTYRGEGSVTIHLDWGTRNYHI